MSDDIDAFIFRDFDLDMDPARDFIAFTDHTEYEAAVKAAEAVKDFQGVFKANERWWAQMALRGYRKHYEETGDARTVLSAIDLCAREKLTIAPWAAEAFTGMWERVEEHEVRSWDELFGTMWPKHYPLKAKRVARALQFNVWRDVRRAHDGGRGRAIETDLFDEIGKRYGISSGTASTYYYDVQEIYRSLG